MPTKRAESAITTADMLMISDCSEEDNMITRPFFALGKPKLKYPAYETSPEGELKEITLPSIITLLTRDGGDTLSISTKDQVKTGQKLKPFTDDEIAVISPVTGTI